MLIHFMLYISVTINGSAYEAIPRRFDTQEACEAAALTYNGIADVALCFPAPDYLFKGKADDEPVSTTDSS